MKNLKITTLLFSIVYLLATTLTIVSCNKESLARPSILIEDTISTAPYTACFEVDLTINNGGVYHCFYTEMDIPNQHYIIEYPLFNSDSSIKAIVKRNIPFIVVDSIRPHFKCYPSWVVQP